jgi:hypothetical protein
MKAEDLMIGDWVYITEPDDFHGYIGKVVITNAETNYIAVRIPNMHLHDVFVEDLQPIPLTVEILEKNGCKKWTWHNYPHENVATYAIGDGIQVEVTKKDGFWLVDNCSDSGDYGYESNWIANVNYVHKLQHLIRDLEIEKEINI